MSTGENKTNKTEIRLQKISNKIHRYCNIQFYV